MCSGTDAHSGGVTSTQHVRKLRTTMIHRWNQHTKDGRVRSRSQQNLFWKTAESQFYNCRWIWVVHPKAETCHLQSNSVNRLTPNDLYVSRTAPLTSKRCILYIYSTNVGTEYFKHALYTPFFTLQNAVCFIMLTCLVPVLFTFYIQGVLKLKKKK